MKHVSSFNLFQLSCATSGMIFNLLKCQYLVEVEMASETAYKHEKLKIPHCQKVPKYI